MPGAIVCSVSSVLNKDSKQFGKDYMFDGSDDTCWNSDQGSPQWVSVKLKTPKIISVFTIQFQGGFVGKDCTFTGENINEEKFQTKFYPEDVNSTQTFNLPQPAQLKSFKIIFNSSTDLFGRIIIYKLSWS